jgi:alpha-beta hydrolase superfamily lysophospholipase
VISRAEGWLAGAEGIALRWYRWDVAAARGGVLIVHGFGDHAGRYHDVARVLNARGYSVLAYDGRGHGASEGPRGHADSFELHLADLDAAWLEARRSLRGPHFLYGHSFGGLTAMRWLQTRPQHRPAGVVLSAPWLATALRVPRFKLLAARILLRVAPSLAISSGANVPEHLTRDPERAAAYLNDPLVHHLISARFHAEALAAQAAAKAAPLPDGLAALLIVPGDDPLVDAGSTLAWARERGRGADVRVREGGRHELHNDIDRDEVLASVADWLDALGRPNP